MIFLGTGIAFSTKIEDGNWGYLDTSSILGVITSNGCLTYDANCNALYISGTTSDGYPQIAKLTLKDLYNYATDGAWLPLLASDGVPAYIKAKTLSK